MSIVTQWVTTPALPEGGNIKYLFDDKLVMSCVDGKALGQLKYNIDQSNNQNIGYSYVCNNFTGLKSNVPAVETSQIAVGSGETYLLKDLRVDCGKRPLTKLQLKQTADGKNMYYTYSCGDVDLKNITAVKKTVLAKADKEKGYPTYDLAPHNLDCGTGYLTSFQLKPTEDLGQYQYDYICGDNGGASYVFLFPWWIWLIIGIMFISMIVIIIFLRTGKKHEAPPSHRTPPPPFRNMGSASNPYHNQRMIFYPPLRNTGPASDLYHKQITTFNKDEGED